MLAAGCGGGTERQAGAESEAPTPVPGEPTGEPVDTLALQRRARALQADLESRLSGLDSTRGRGTAGDLDYSYIAYFEGEDLVLIREHQDSGDYGISDNEYYYADSSLVYYVQGQVSRTLNPGSPPSSDAIVVRLYFDPESRLAHAEKTVNGMPVELEGFEELAVRRRSETLRAAALAGGGQHTVEATRLDPPVAVELEPGGEAAVYEGRIIARQVRNYVVTAKRGQRLSVRLDTESRYAQFVVQFVGQSVYDSRRTGERSWSDELPRDGEYTVRVYLTRGEAERGGTAEYTLTIGLEAPEDRRS